MIDFGNEVVWLGFPDKLNVDYVCGALDGAIHGFALNS
jgi:hypothetical protein